MIPGGAGTTGVSDPALPLLASGRYISRVCFESEPTVAFPRKDPRG